MATAPSANNLLLGRGAVYFDPFSTGTTRTGEFHLGNCSVFEETTEDELKEKYSSMSGAATLYKSVHIKRTCTFKITLDEFNLKNLRLALQGTAGTLSQSTATITDEAVTTSAIQGCYYPTTKRVISTVSVKSGSPGSESARTVTTDYTVDATTGRIFIVEGGGITAGHKVLVTYTYATQTFNVISGGDASDINGYLRFIGAPAAGPTYELEIWNCQLTPDGAIGFISDDFASFSLNCKAQDDSTNHPTAPLYRLIERV